MNFNKMSEMFLCHFPGAEINTLRPVHLLLFKMAKSQDFWINKLIG